MPSIKTKNDKTLAPKKPTHKFVGATGTTIYGGTYQEDYLNELRWPDAYDVYDEMRRGDAQVRQVLRAIKNPIKSAKFKHEPATDDARDQEIAEYLDWVWFDNPYLDFHQWLTEVLTFVDFGFSVHETIFITYDHKRFGPVHILGGMGFRKQSTIWRWIIDGSEGLQAVEQLPFGDTVDNLNQRIYIPAERLCIFTNEKEGDNYVGVSFLRNCYGPWFRKNLYLKINGIGIERAAVGTPVGKYPRGSESDGNLAEFEKALQNFTTNENNYILTPEKFEIEVHKSDFDSEKIMSSVKYEDAQMSRSALLQFLELGQNGAGGAYALGKDQSDMVLDALQYMGNGICQKMHAINEKLVRWNFGDVEELPRPKCSGINSKAGKELAEIVKNYVTTEVIRPDDTFEAHIRETHNLPAAERTREEDREKETGQDPEGGKEDGGEDPPNPKKDGAKQEDDPPKTGDEDEREKKTDAKKVFAEGFEPFRELTVYEEPLDLAETVDEFDTETNRLRRQMRNKLNQINDFVLNELQKRLKQHPKDPQKVAGSIRINTNGYRKTILSLMGALVAAGSKQAKRELEKKMGDREFAEEDTFKADVEFLPEHVKKGLKLQAEEQAKSHAEEIEKKVKMGLIAGISDELSQKEILSRVEEDLTKFAESQQIDSAAATIASQAINRGRNGFFQNTEALKVIQGFQYSAVIDSRTTAICLSLDGKTFKKGDPSGDRLRAPNHHQCRSILVPITIKEKTPDWTGLDIDPTNESLVKQMKEKGKPVPDLEAIKKTRNL